jgi:hypothetical protein
LRSEVIILKWTLVKRKLMNLKYGTPNGTALAHAALLSDMSHDDSHVLVSLDMPNMEECTDEYDNTYVSVAFNSVAFSSSLAPVVISPSFG